MQVPVRVMHGGSNITQYVVSYDREQKMCTGIHMIDLRLSANCPQHFDTYDTIDIYEENVHKGEFFINNHGDVQPDYTYTINAQDASKLLVDYFITDTYTVTEPSYARYWIEKFLDEVGITYEFTVEDSGSVLNNNTALGLMSAYDQIFYLLQISGWFIYFDDNNTAIIGKIDVDLSKYKFSLSKRQLTKAKIVTNDNMLRNRSVVWGGLDPVTNSTIFSDQSTVTPWNYDAEDLRATVISNGYIANQGDADELAFKVLNEFARITEECHVVAWGERNAKIGDVVRVFTKNRKVTTQGALLNSKEGLQTKIIMDERCPRLFAYFNYGDYVYVGTETSGVWRKHILYSGIWSGFNQGLPEYGISDLFVLGGVASTVTMSGGSFITLTSEDYATWSGITISSLPTFDNDGNPYVVESGILSRNIIHDKLNNHVRVLVDNRPGNNYPGYFEMYSGLFGSGGVFAKGSGMSMSGIRAWVLDISVSGDPAAASGILLNDAMSGMVLISSYPVNYSGGYEFIGIDIENDGRNDFVSVFSGWGSGDYYFGQADQLTQKMGARSATPSGHLLDDFYGGGGDHYVKGVFLSDDPDDTELTYIYGVSTGSKVIKRFKTDPSGIITIKTALVGDSTVQYQSPFPLTVVYRTFKDSYRAFCSKDGNIQIASVSLDTGHLTFYDTGITSAVFPTQLNDRGYILQNTGTAIPSTGIKSDMHVVDYFNRKTTTTVYEKTMAPGAVIDDFTLYYFPTRDGVKYFGKLRWRDPASASPRYRHYLMLYGIDTVNEVEIDPNTFTTSHSVDLTFGSFNAIAAQGYYHINTHTDYIYSDCSTYEVDSSPRTVYGLNGGGRWVSENFDGISYKLPDDFGIGIVDVANPSTYTYIPLPPNRMLQSNPFPRSDDLGNIYILTGDTVSREVYLTPISPVFGAIYSGVVVGKSFDEFGWHSIHGFNLGRIFALATELSPVNYGMTVWLRPSVIREPFLILRREDTEFHRIWGGDVPFRLDISNTSPLLSVQDIANTFNSFYISTSGVVNLYSAASVIPSGEATVWDQRYTGFSTLSQSGYIVGSGVEGASGIPTSGQARYAIYTVKDATFSGIILTPINSFDTLYGPEIITSGLPVLLSGAPEMLEATCFSYPDQYVFVTTSGDYGSGTEYKFYQKNPSGYMGFFECPSGFPFDSRTTIIRIEDSI